MSSEENKAAVLSAIKVRTKLRGDNSWMQLHNTPETKTTSEKPWMAEVKARRSHGAFAETSPVTPPTESTPPPTKSDTERAPASGFLIRGVFTKLDTPTPPSSSNGSSRATQFTKRASDGYKKIAPHTVRPASDGKEDLLSQEEQEKRAEAASHVLKKSSVRQRSYVLSAAKKFESREDAASTTIVPSSQPLVAKRVMINDDDESPTTPSPVTPVESVTAAPQPKPRSILDTRVKALNEEEEAAHGPVKEDHAPPPVSVTKADPFEHMKPGCTKVATPLPELILDNIQTVCTEPDAGDSRQADTPLVDLTSTQDPTGKTEPEPSPVPDAPVSDVTDITVNTEPEPSPVPDAPVSDVTDIMVNTEPEPSPVPYAPVSDVTDITVNTEPEPSPVPYAPVSDVTDITVNTEPEPSPVPYAPVSDVTDITVNTEPEPSPVPDAPVSDVTDIMVNTEPEPSPVPYAPVSDVTDIMVNTEPEPSPNPSFKDDDPELAKEGGGSADSRTTDNGFETNNFFSNVTAGVEQEPVPEISNCVPMTDDLLELTEGPEAPAEPVAPSLGRWSQDLLGSLNSESNPEQTSVLLDFMTNDVITINTEPRSFSTQREEERLTGETDKDTQSSTETVTVTTKTVIITDKSEQDNADAWVSHVTTTVTESSSADLFDPYPIGTTSPNSSTDLLQPYSDSPLATSTENKEPSPSPRTILGTHRWGLTWDTSAPQQANPEESQGGGKTMLVMFERKSTENESPWDRWTSPTICTITTEEEEEQEAEEGSPEDVQTHTITTITTIRETESQPQPTMDRYETHSQSVIEDQRVQTPEPEAKMAIVYVKEYINSTEQAFSNTGDANYGGSDCLTSNSASYSYSTPPAYMSGSLSPTCTYCGELVGSDAKISIAHLNIISHPACFKCDVCGKPMGDMLDRMFLHAGKVNCDTCYSEAFE